jgi:hypothetical protein
MNAEEGPGPPRRRVDPLAHAQNLTEETAQRLISLVEASAPVKRIRASHALSAVIGTVGFALFIVGVERAAADIPLISNAYGSIAIGLVLLGITGLLLRRLGGPD